MTLFLIMSKILIAGRIVLILFLIPLVLENISELWTIITLIVELLIQVYFVLVVGSLQDKIKTTDEYPTQRFQDIVVSSTISNDYSATAPQHDLYVQAYEVPIVCEQSKYDLS